MKYREGTPMVLRGISADIKGGERVGVVGRTGAGKSSLLAALLRMVEPERGVVRLRGVVPARTLANPIAR